VINEQKNTSETVGQRIKIARESEGLTQSELAVKLGYTSPTAISLIEAGERSVKVEVLTKIATILHQDGHYLATGRKNQATVKTALRADSNFDTDDVKKIESFIDYLMSQKQDNGRGNKKD
jgi:transcriptional regulator with XRE-family HTH domain